MTTIAALLCGSAGQASAHPEFAPARINRYVKLSLVGGGAIRLAYTVMIGEVPAAAQRRAADRNGDGTLDPDEAKAWAAQLAAIVARGIAIEVDGAPATAIFEPPVVGGLSDPRVAPIPFSVDLVARIPTGGGSHTLRYDDASDLPCAPGDLGDIEVRLEEGPGTRIVAAWHARDDGKIQTRFAWTGPKFSAIEDRSIGFRFVDSTAPARRRRMSLPIALFAAPLGAAMAFYFARRGRRRKA